MGKCPRCGKPIGWIGALTNTWHSKVYHSEWDGQTLHWDCWSQTLHEEEKVIKSKTLCQNCNYYRSYTNDLTVDTGIFVPNVKSFSSEFRYCAKFGFSLQADGKEAEKCTSYITEEDYKEKALRGEINPQTDTNFKICVYCQTKYDLNRTSACPKCGAL